MSIFRKDKPLEHGSIRVETNLAGRLNLLAVYAWACMLFCLPFSTALALLFSLIGTALSLCGLRVSVIRDALSVPTVVVCILLFLWILVSSSWSIAPGDELFEGVFKYRKLLYVPLIAISIYSSGKNPEELLKFFIFGCLIIAFLSLGVRFHLMDFVLGSMPSPAGWPIGGSEMKSWFHIGPPENPTIGRNHISQGAFLVFASWLLWVKVYSKLRAGLDSNFIRISLLAAAAYALLFSVFGLKGRTGYLLATIVCAMGIFALLKLRNRRFLILLIWCAGFVLLYNSSPNFSDRSAKAIQESITYNPADPQGQGVRISWWMFALEKSAESPIGGFGAGSYPELYAQNLSHRKKFRESRVQPHSEPLIQLVHGGLVGLFLYMLIFISPIILLWRRREHLRLLQWGGLLLLFFVHSTYNSALWDLAEGHYLVALLGIISSFLIKNKKTKKGVRIE
jgi:O-antigen ligase